MVSWCGNPWDANINPIAMLKRVPAFAAACRDYTKNFILCEKYTQQSYQSDMESLCLGAYLSGYSGQYGIRYDDTGWTDADGNHGNFTMATGGAPHLEHIMLTGQTVIDAPELIWTQCFREINAGSTSNGYTMRRWDTFPQFDNVSVDLFRKILDGTARIPSRQEVIDRTKVVIINDINSGSHSTIYSSPETLYEGLYRMDGDGNYENNKTFFKKTGRYPTIPVVFQLDDAQAISFQLQVNRSAYADRWPTIADKVNEFDNLFPQEYTGDLYAGRHENGWVIYNPYKTGQTAEASIPFKYNTCDHIDLTCSQYTSGIIKEYPDYLTIYLNNYDNVIDTGLKTDTIKLFGSLTEPVCYYTDRAGHQPSIVTSDWSGGVFTLTIAHNGPLDITVNCTGTATNRLVSYTPATLIAPDQPMRYTGPRQYEAECFDYKSISGIVKGGYSGSLRNYTGQGYLQFGTSSAAGVRDTVSVLEDGIYRLETRYAVTGANVNTIDLNVNGTKVATLALTQTANLSDWTINRQDIFLNAGENTIELRANAASAAAIYFDNMVVVPTTYDNGMNIQENEPGYVDLDGIIDRSYPGYTGDGYANPNDSIGAGINWKMDFDSSTTKSLTFRYACPDNRTASLIVNGTTIIATDIQFPSTGSWSTWDFITVYVGADTGVSGLRLQSMSATGLPNIDCLEVVGIIPEIPATPTGLSIMATEDLVTLNWNTNTENDLAGYHVYRSILPDTGYTRLNKAVLGKPSFTDQNANYYTTYYYQVTALDTDDNESDRTDTISIMPVDSSAIPLIATDFETGLRDWINVTGDDSHDWLRNSSGTLTPNTGPANGADGSDWYVYLETSPGGAYYAGNDAILQSPMIPGFNRVLKFDYHMFGVEIGTLNIDIYDGVWHNAVWSLGGQQQNSNTADFGQAFVNLSEFTGPIQIRFRAVAAGGSKGDIALDNIIVMTSGFYGDINNDKIVDTKDLVEFSGHWLRDSQLDLDGDSTVSLYEFSALTCNWLK